MNADSLLDSQSNWDVDSCTADQLSQSTYGRPETDNHTLGGWVSVISQLLEWRKDPSQLLDEDYIPPSRGILDLAMAVAHWARTQKLYSPSNVVPDGDGGVAFERKDGAQFETILIASDAQVKFLSFQDSKLIGKQVLSSDRFMIVGSPERPGEVVETGIRCEEPLTLSSMDLRKAA